VNQPLSVALGLCVRALRQEQGWTQVTFSERCGFYQTYLSRIENGQANPTLNAMEVIAGGLGLTIFQLFDKVRLREAADLSGSKSAADQEPPAPKAT
jgi:transcriptional regulator with XRE-family HTH domain